MQGANEYAMLFSTGLYGQLYIISGSHARGKRFHIYVVPPGTTEHTFKWADSVEVYGVVSGQPGWSEIYGWKHEGKWVEDFKKLVEKRKLQIQVYKGINQFISYLKNKSKQDKQLDILNSYKG